VKREEKIVTFLYLFISDFSSYFLDDKQFGRIWTVTKHVFRNRLPRSQVSSQEKRLTWYHPSHATKV